jgi:hyperosmotically inducible protein
MKFLLGLILGIVLVLAIIWYFADQRHNSTAQDAKNHIESAANGVKESVQTNWKSLRTEDIKEELARNGRVVRQKAQDIGHSVADATADARITTTIKGKLLANPDLSALSISVNTTAGRVTLSGTVSSPDKIREAMQLALDTDGVQEVVSTLQVKS